MTSVEPVECPECHRPFKTVRHRPGAVERAVMRDLKAAGVKGSGREALAEMARVQARRIDSAGAADTTLTRMLAELRTLMGVVTRGATTKGSEELASADAFRSDMSTPVRDGS